MRPGVRGQATAYGTPVGIGQMLPATAREMALKNGLPWDQSLYSGTTPEAAAYQAKLGASYLHQGLRETGNVRDALRYYYGGPNRAMWGPKTNAYADQVLGRLTGM
jgi:soluble lytic murein transglycosylase-like protein